MAGMPVVPCPACGHPIVWARDPSARRTPVDADASPEGTLSLATGWDGTPQVRRPSARLAYGRTNLHRPHATTCTKKAQLKTHM